MWPATVISGPSNLARTGFSGQFKSSLARELTTHRPVDVRLAGTLASLYL
jgi:hypothetical protein